MHFFWEKKNWLAMPEASPDVSSILESIAGLRRRIFELADCTWFGALQKELFIREIFSSWDIEGLPLYGLRQHVRLIEDCTGFARSEFVLTPDAIAGCHDAVISKTEKGFRSSAVGVGRSESELVYLAPPAEDVPRLLDEFCRNLNAAHADAHLRAAFAHAAFVLIHPFADGNGRMARLVASRLVPDILIDASRFVYVRRSRYYESLMKISAFGDLDQFFVFLLCRYEEAYCDLLRDMRNFSVYFEMHGGEFTTMEDMQERVAFDIENAHKYI